MAPRSTRLATALRNVLAGKFLLAVCAALVAVEIAVRAFDEAGNRSEPSGRVCASTLDVPRRSRRR